MKMFRTFKVPLSGHAIEFSWISQRPECVYAAVECDSIGHENDAPEALTHEDLERLYHMVGEMLDLTKA